MLRAVQTRSPLSEFEQGSFASVLDDTPEDATVVTRAVLASGKIAHEVIARRNETGATSVAVVRVEQLYPWPRAAIDETLSRYPNLHEIYWLQEEPENMGAWPFVHLQMHSQFRGMTVGHVARAESASPATGSSLIHSAEQADLVTRALG
jgi:2-oxoglutarate dehydrogenase E1 component